MRLHRSDTVQLLMYRVRIVFNAPADREHPFYSVPKESAKDVHQVLIDLAPVLIHAVSVSIQRTDSPVGKGGWQQITTDQFYAALDQEGAVPNGI